MANPEDDRRQGGGSPDGRLRRQPPIIDVKAVEVSLDGPSTSPSPGPGGKGPTDTMLSPKRLLAALSSIRASLSSAKFVIIGSVCVVAIIAAGALWIYLPADGVDGRRHNAAARDSVRPDDVIESVAKPETALKAPLSQTLPDSELANRVAALEAKLAPLADRIAELEGGVRDNAAAARIAGERADKVAGLFDEAKKSDDEQNLVQQREQRTIENLADRLKKLESVQIALQQKQEELERVANATTAAPDKVVRVAMIATALRNAVAGDTAFMVELAAARSLGLDESALAGLEPFAATGVPTRNELLRGLSALIPELLRVSAPVSRDLGYLDRLQASAVKMLNIRPVRDEPGDDPTTVIGRIEFKMGQQDIAGAVAELDKLPAPAKELAQPWLTKALARQGAIESVRLIATASLAKLGEPTIRGPSPQ